MKLAHAFFFAMSFGVALGDGRALTWNGWLAQAADAHSRDMAQRN